MEARMTNVLVVNPLGYPKELERTAVLRNGVRVHLRPIRPEDAPRLMALYERLSVDTAYRRFFTRMTTLPPELAHYFANVDYQRRLAIVAELPEGQAPLVIGVGGCEPTDSPTTAEVALVVEDAWQRLGLGTILLGELLHASGQRGICEFRADVLKSNDRMLRLLARHTDVTRRRTQHGVTEIFFHRRPAAAVGTR
jgi:GNAT superfamily N-acetyltransferase